jgi:phospho-N-acetylmuramoyl-pentapeptide-transferase
VFYQLSELQDVFSPFRVFQYITVRTFLASGTAFLLSLLFGSRVIRALSNLKAAQQFRDDQVLKDHLKKTGTPTMGGVMIILTTVIASLLWGQPNMYLLLTLGTLVYLGLVGFIDDYRKIHYKNSKGLSGKWKLLLQGLWALLVLAFLWNTPETQVTVQQLFVPFLKDPLIPAMGVVFSLIFIFMVMVGCSNAVNLTDGLDGLAIGCSNSVMLAYLILSYAAGHFGYASYLQIPFVQGAGELTVFCGALLGSGLGFLWFNAHPARVFMGDTGSLAIGGAIAMVAILIKQEMTLFIVGGIFVLEALSVILQVSWFKFTRKRYGVGRRIFLIAPLHHHFERKEKELEQEHAVEEGREPRNIESRVVARFVILSIIFALMGIATLKIR